VYKKAVSVSQLAYCFLLQAYSRTAVVSS